MSSSTSTEVRNVTFHEKLCILSKVVNFYLQVSSDRINSQNFKPLCHALIHNFVPILFPFFDGLMIIQIMVNQGFVAYRSAF